MRRILIVFCLLGLAGCDSLKKAWNEATGTEPAYSAAGRLSGAALERATDAANAGDSAGAHAWLAIAREYREQGK